MAKAKSSKKDASPSLVERNANLQALREQYYGVKSEIAKVTWPTREESRALTTAVIAGTVTASLFLVLVDFIFQSVTTGVVALSIGWIITGVILIGIVAAGFYINNREV